jgi:hypothetical protein
MMKVLADALLPKDYQELPDMIRASYSPQEWLWLSDREKAMLIQTETEPDIYID